MGIRDISMVSGLSYSPTGEVMGPHMQRPIKFYRIGPAYYAQRHDGSIFDRNLDGSIVLNNTILNGIPAAGGLIRFTQQNNLGADTPAIVITEHSLRVCGVV
jgi:hypothetical protein